MVLTLIDSKRQESSQVGDQLQNKLAELSAILKNCNVNLKLLHILDGDSLQGLLIMKPDSHIKILEENLLNNTRYSCSNFQMESDYCSVQEVSRTSSTDKIEHTALTHRLTLHEETDLNSKFKVLDITDLPSVTHKNHTLSNKDTIVNSNLKFTFPPVLNDLNEDNAALNFQNNMTMDNIINFKKEERPTHKTSSTDCMSKNSIPLCLPINTSKNNLHSELDNGFKFTIEEEKILSFVFGPSPLMELNDQSTFKHGNISNGYNQESDKHSGHSSSKGGLISETVNTVLYKNSNSCDMMKRSSGQTHDHSRNNNFSWNPSTQQKHVGLYSSSNPHMYNWPPSNNSENTNLHQNITGFHKPFNSYNSSNSQNRFKTLCSQETILFREAALRGSYDLEAILKNVKPPLENVEHEIVKVREAIFSAVRSQQKGDSLISDNVLSVLDIIKAWIKMNSYLECEEFKDNLEACGCGTSVLQDFLQWQCTSRTFMDKIISNLKSISYRKTGDMNSPSCNNSSHSFHPSAHKPLDLAVVNQGINLSFDSKYNRKMVSPTNVQTKHWRQQQLQSDHMNQEVAVNKHKRLLRSNLTVTNSFNGFHSPSSGNINMAFGQGDNMFLCSNRDVNFDHSKINLFSKPGGHIKDSGFVLNCSKLVNKTSVLTGVLENNGSVQKPFTNHVNELSSIKFETNIYPPNHVSDTLSGTSMNNVVNSPVNNCFSASTQFIPTIPLFCNNRQCFPISDQIQPNFSQALNKPNPIHCIDTDLGEDCLKSNYMKPGSYNPPQKPLTCQKVINNYLSFEDTPVIGIPFLYNNTQLTALKKDLTKSFTTANANPSQTHNEQTETRSDDTWKTAMSLAETFRDSMIAIKSKSDPNLKVSETVSLRSHFLLSDETNQHEFSNEMKLGSETDQSNSSDKPATTSDIEVPVVDAELKTADWLTNSFDRKPSENNKETSTTITKYVRSSCDSSGMNENVDYTCQQDQMKHKHYTFLPAQGESDKEKDSVNTDGMSILGTQLPNTSPVNQIYQDTQLNVNFRKPRKNKKLRDDHTNMFDSKPMLLCKKPKSIFKKSMTKHMSCKLEEILNCIWGTELSDIVGIEVKSQKDKARLDFKIKCPLYIQAMRCKLVNHSYDTLEQALHDFQQYFLDIKSRNKGDKQCIEVVGALERLFLDLVEKHFGLLYQPTPQYFGPIGMPPSLKAHKPKKTPRRF